MDDEGSLAQRFPLGAAVTVAQLEDDPHETLHRLRTHEPVSWLPATRGWWVTRHSTAVEVLRDSDTFTVDDPRFSTARVIGPSMLSTDGAEHDRHRAPFNEPFRRTEVQHAFSEWLGSEARRRVATFRSAGRADLSLTLARPLAVEVIARALGLVDVDPDTMSSWYGAIVAEVSRLTAGEPPTGEGRAAFDRIRAAVDETVAASPKALVTAIAERGRLDQVELAANVAVMMFGGIETSEAMTANALWHLLSHPEEVAALSAHGGRMDAVIDESLRLEPAATLVDRYATRDTTLAGVPIHQGDPVTVSLAAANRDPAVFDHPDRFVPTRPNPGLHLSFVPGPHACLGRHLARLETAAAIDAVLDLLAEVRLDQASSPPRGLVFRKPPGVVARWSVDPGDAVPGQTTA